MVGLTEMEAAVRTGSAGRWAPAGGARPEFGPEAIERALLHVDRPAFVVEDDGRLGVATGGIATLGDAAGSFADRGMRLRAAIPALHPSQLGDASFCAANRLRYAYVAGAMANGIASETLVEAMGRAGMIGFFGAAGLTPQRVEQAIDRLQSALGDQPHGFNLIHSPAEPDLENAIVDLYLRRGVRLVSASAYLDLTPAIVRYRASGMRRGAGGEPVAANRLVAKVSRVEVARRFFSPPPAKLLAELVEQGAITREQAALAERLPMADGLTAEADSGGHTDNRPLVALLPTMIALRDELHAKHGYSQSIAVGAAGGISTPASAAAAFAMGAAYVLTGSVNQACVEAGTSDEVKRMLAQAGPADVAMAPAADMFEMGVKVQVLKWGTMFAARAQKLYELYRAHESLEALPPAQRASLERDFLRCTLEEAWAATRAFFERRDPRQIERAERDPRHRMALVFRAYLGQSSKWAVGGEASRKADYQVWCGPAMGAFNEWTRGTPLAEPANRDVVTVAWNLLRGAAVVLRASWLRAQGVALPAGAPRVRPMMRSELAELMEIDNVAPRELWGGE